MRSVKIKNSNDASAGDAAWTLHRSRVKGYRRSGKLSSSCWVFIKLKLSYGPGLTLLGICPIEMRIYVSVKSGPRMLILALLVITPDGKQPRCPSVHAWSIP